MRSVLGAVFEIKNEIPDERAMGHNQPPSTSVTPASPTFLNARSITRPGDGHIPAALLSAMRCNSRDRESAFL